MLGLWEADQGGGLAIAEAVFAPANHESDDKSELRKSEITAACRVRKMKRRLRNTHAHLLGSLEAAELQALLVRPLLWGEQ